MDYNQWNIVLAKRFAVMHKNYRKFSLKFMGKDPCADMYEENKV